MKVAFIDQMSLLLQLLLGADVACVSTLPFAAVCSTGMKTSIAPETTSHHITCYDVPETHADKQQAIILLYDPLCDITNYSVCRNKDVIYNCLYDCSYLQTLF